MLSQAGEHSDFQLLSVRHPIFSPSRRALSPSFLRLGDDSSGILSNFPVESVDQGRVAGAHPLPVGISADVRGLCPHIHQKPFRGADSIVESIFETHESAPSPITGHGAPRLLIQGGKIASTIRSFDISWVVSQRNLEVGRIATRTAFVFENHAGLNLLSHETLCPYPPDLMVV